MSNYHNMFSGISTTWFSLWFVLWLLMFVMPRMHKTCRYFCCWASVYNSLYGLCQITAWQLTVWAGPPVLEAVLWKYIVPCFQKLQWPCCNKLGELFNIVVITKVLKFLGVLKAYIYYIFISYIDYILSTSICYENLAIY